MQPDKAGRRRASQSQFLQQQKAAHDLLISNQVPKGFEQLASEKPVMRLGGIYALEGVMNTSDQYRVPVLEALCAFVRDSTNGMTDASTEKPATDIQATLTVIGRRTKGAGLLDVLAGTRSDIWCLVERSDFCVRFVRLRSFSPSSSGLRPGRSASEFSRNTNVPDVAAPHCIP